MLGRVKFVSGGGGGGADGWAGEMPANPLKPAFTAAAGFGGDGACGGFAAGAGRGGGIRTGGSGGGAVTGCACQTWPHLEQRTLRPSGGKTALVS